MDNSVIHKSSKTKEIIQSSGRKVLYLTPYSSDLNPIENFWATIKKARIRNLSSSEKSLNHAIDRAFQYQ